MNLKLPNLTSYLMICTLLFAFGCKKDKQVSEDPKTLPVVTSMNYYRYDGFIYTDGPRFYNNFILNNLGVPNTDILINGHNFSQDFRSSKVIFSNISVTAIDGDSTRIVVRIPDNVAPGPVTLTINTNGKSIVHPTKFSVETPDPQISGVNIEGGMPGSKLIIYGKDFSTTVANNQVNINGVNAKIDSAGLTAIYATVPQSTGSGKIVLTTHGVALTYKNNFKTVASTFSILNPNSPGIVLHNLTLDAAGNVYGTSSNIVYKLSPDGTTNVLAQIPSSPDAIPFIAGCAVDATGNVFLASPYVNVPSRASIQINGSSKIYKVTPAGVVSAFAGGGYPGETDGKGEKALFFRPGYMAFDNSGNLFVNDIMSIRKVTPDGTVSTFAPSPGGSMTMDKNTGIIYMVSSTLTNGTTFTVKVKKIMPNGTTTVTDAGPMTDAYIPDINVDKSVNYPGVGEIAVDASGDIYAAVGANIYKISNSTITNTFLGPTTRGIVSLTLDLSGKIYLTVPVNPYNFFGRDNYAVYKINP